ncbi:MAG: LysR family transcriptional regulator [Xanthobacteraceae bacterium]|jgi:DNA-binding transcriptional LysR family regulator
MIPCISFRHLQYFVAVFEEGSFTKAAERERCTQPALSAQVRNVEELVGTSLFERSVTGAVPTAAGKRFYRHAISILRSLRMAEIDMAPVTEQISGTVRAGVIPSLVRGILPSFLHEFVEKHPAIDLRITESFSGTLTSWLLAHEIDLAFVVEPPRHEGLEMEKLVEAPAVLISSKAFGLSPGPLQLCDIPPVKMIMPGHRHSLRATIERAIWTRSLKVTRILEMDSVPGMITFVRSSSDWATILPFAAIVRDRDDPDLILNPITDAQFETNLYLVHLIQFPLSPAAHEFVEALRRETNRTRDFLSNDVKVRFTAGRHRARSAKSIR